jgi:hypothetical protein
MKRARPINAPIAHFRLEASRPGSPFSGVQMKPTAGDRSMKEETIAHKRALIRSLIEQNGYVAPKRAIVLKIDPTPTKALAQIIPFPLGGRLDDE